jgi:TnpA family transposase
MEDESFKASPQEKRLKILASDEIKSIYGRPHFNYEERLEYFALSHSDLEILEGFRSLKSQVHFILQLGYFRAKYLFFIFTLDEVEDDFQYIMEQYFDSRQIGGITVIDKQTRLKQQRLILELYGYRNCTKEERQELEQRARQSAMVYSKPIYVFRELINYLTKHKIILPGYSLMQKVVSRAINSEQSRLINITKNLLQASELEDFKKLLEDSTGLYEITQLKHEPKDFSLAEIRREIQRGEQLHPFYRIARRLLPELKISNESIKYYASLVGYYSVFRLKQLNEWTAYLYLICFTYHRYQQRSDNLINCLIFRVRNYSDEAKSVAKERLQEYHVEINENLQKAGQVLKLLTDESIDCDTPFKTFQSNAFKILPRQKLITVANRMAKAVNFDETAFQWEYIDKLSRQFKLHLRQAIVTIEFTSTLSQDALIEAVEFLKAAFKKGKPLKEFPSELFPVDCVPASVTSYLYAQDSKHQKQLIPDRYEFLIYRLLRNGLKKGVVSYTLVANHIPVNAKIIGANEHESHFVFDILFNNTTDIQPEIHSTDTHGTNQINFAVLHSFGYQFAPRYKDIYDKVSKALYGFKHPSNYEGVIKPIRKLNTELIVEEWENIQRIMVSLAVKETTQSIIVGKLSAYARKNKTRRALWEYDNILKSLYLLDYIDSLPLRQNVQRALNRGESYHQLRRAISYANFGKLRFKSELEQQLWSECGRLIANCILYYNASILSNVLAHRESSGDVEGIEVLKQISPVAWQHINLYGRYEFRKCSEPIDLDEIVRQLTQVQLY